MPNLIAITDTAATPFLRVLFPSQAVGLAIVQGKVAQAEIDKKIAKALAGSQIVRLGGQQKDFGRCLAVLAGETDLSQIRSQLGNSLAAKSGEEGLRSIGLIAYREVRPLAFGVRFFLHFLQLHI